MKCFAALNKRETYTMAHIIYLLFPGARYNPSGSIQPKVLRTAACSERHCHRAIR